MDPTDESPLTPAEELRRLQLEALEMAQSWIDGDWGEQSTENYRAYILDLASRIDRLATLPAKEINL